MPIRGGLCRLYVLKYFLNTITS